LDARKDLLRLFAGFVGVATIDGPKCHAALFRPEAVLRDPCALPTSPNPEAEAGEPFIEHNHLALALGKFEALDCCLFQFHRRITGKQLGSTIVMPPGRFCFPRSSATTNMSIV
jgi:hypothetical protein